MDSKSSCCAAGEMEEEERERGKRGMEESWTGEREVRCAEGWERRRR